MMQVWSLWAIALTHTHTHDSPTYTILESSKLTHINEMIHLCFDGTSVTCWSSWHGYDPRMPCSKEDGTDRRRGRMIFTRVANHCQRSGEERELSFSSVHCGLIRFSLSPPITSACEPCISHAGWRPIWSKVLFYAPRRTLQMLQCIRRAQRCQRRARRHVVGGCPLTL